MYDKWVVESHQKANDNAALQQKITECEKTYKQKKAALKDKISASEDKIAYLSNEGYMSFVHVLKKLYQMLAAFLN